MALDTGRGLAFDEGDRGMRYSLQRGIRVGVAVAGFAWAASGQAVEQWVSHGIIIRPAASGGNHAYLPGSGGTQAEVRFWVSSSDGTSAEPASNDLAYSAAVHPHTAPYAVNVASGYWHLVQGGGHYPYFGKSSVARGSDAGEAGPYPDGETGPLDLQFHPTLNAGLSVIAFVAPADGDYSIQHFGIRRVSSWSGITSVRIENPARQVLAGTTLTCDEDLDWVLASGDVNLPGLRAGDRIHFVLSRHDFSSPGVWDYDNTEIHFRISNVSTGPATPTNPPPLVVGALIPPPADPALYGVWRQQLADWKTSAHTSYGYNPAASTYNDAAFAWSKSNYNCAFAMLWDTRLLDPVTGRFRVAEFLEEMRLEYGSFDSIMLWQAYPVMGVDNRNQFDHYRDMPGGLEGVRNLVRDFHAAGVKCFLSYNPWDVYTRREGVSDTEALRAMIVATDADGIFLDTAENVAGLRAALDGPSGKPGVILEGEFMAGLGNIPTLHNSWAQGTAAADTPAPSVLRNKWYEPRHLNHQIDRWNSDHGAELACAWMNGSGIMVWDNIFSNPNNLLWSEKNKSFLRAVLPIQRRYTGAFANLTNWTPLVTSAMTDVYASLWRSGGERVWTLINRSDSARTGAVLQVVHETGVRYFDLIAGQELFPAPTGGVVTLTVTLQPKGPGCLLAAKTEDLQAGMEAFLAGQQAVHARLNWSASRPARTEVLVPVQPTLKYKTVSELPPGMKVVGPVKNFQVDVTFRTWSRECGGYSSPWSRTVNLGPYAIDEALVSNDDFHAFLSGSGFVPTHPTNFLRHWSGGLPPAGKEDHPAVYVDLSDARAYAAWAGKRLPTEDEWQYAAGGPGKLNYPWGNTDDPTRRNGEANDGSGANGNGFPVGDTSPVRRYDGTHPGYGDGRSPLGCYDMCGNVWQMVEGERFDGISHYNVLKGGSYFKVWIDAAVPGSFGYNWYADGGATNTRFATKFLMSWPGRDRSATIGFRCVVDLHDPFLSAEPADQTVPVGQSVAFSAATVGTAPVTYQWFRNGAILPGATSSVYHAGPVAVADSGAGFSVVVAGRDGAVTSRVAAVTVPQALAVSEQNGRAVVSWEVTGTAWVLEQTGGMTNGVQPVWDPIPPSGYGTNGMRVFYPVPGSVTNRMYRLSF